MILLYRGTSWISKSIRWFTWGDYSHAAWMYPDCSIVEAWHKGGVRRCATPWMGHKDRTVIDVYALKHATEGQLVQIGCEMRRNVGAKYDFAGIRGFYRRKKTQNPDKWFCSELVFDSCLLSGIKLLNNVEPWQVSPTMLSYSPLLHKVGTVSSYKDLQHVMQTYNQFGGLSWAKNN